MQGHAHFTVFRLLPHFCAESSQQLRKDQEVTLAWCLLTHAPLVQHHGLTETREEELVHMCVRVHECRVRVSHLQVSSSGLPGMVKVQ